MLVVSGLATMGVDSVLAPSRETAAATRPFVPTQPVRQSLTPGAGAGDGKAAEKPK
jgi:hypothetical protein